MKRFEKFVKEIFFAVDVKGMNENEKNTKDSKMYANTAYNTYAQNDIGVESPAKLVEMLYEGVLRFNAQAKKAIKDENLEKKVYWTNRSISIVVELVSTLDYSQGQVAEYLDGLYAYEIKLLTLASLENDTAKLDEVSKVFKSLLEAWRESTNVGK
jgi:flagellar protein FliS